MIYFLQAELLGSIKIGYSASWNIEKRISNLQTASPLPLHLLAQMHGNHRTEHKLHKRFDRYWIRGEWFKPGNGLLRFIAKIRNRVSSPDNLLTGGRDLNAARWLIARFTESTEWSSEALNSAANKDGISRNAMYQAKDLLGIPKARQETTATGNRRWVWWVPQSWHSSEPVARLGQLGQLAQDQSDKDIATVRQVSQPNRNGLVATVPIQLDGTLVGQFQKSVITQVKSTDPIVPENSAPKNGA